MIDDLIRAALMTVEEYPDDSEYTRGWIAGVDEQRSRVLKVLEEHHDKK